MTTWYTTVLVAIAFVEIISYFANLAKYYHMATTEQTQSKGMKHLKFQQYNKHYTW